MFMSNDSWCFFAFSLRSAKLELVVVSLLADSSVHFCNSTELHLTDAAAAEGGGGGESP